MRSLMPFILLRSLLHIHCVRTQGTRHRGVVTDQHQPNGDGRCYPVVTFERDGAEQSAIVNNYPQRVYSQTMPVGSAMLVYYSDRFPKYAYADKRISPVLMILTVTSIPLGIGLVVMGIQKLLPLIFG